MYLPWFIISEWIWNFCVYYTFSFLKKTDESKIVWHFKKNKCDVIKMIKSNIKVSPPKYVCPHRIGQRWVTSKILNHPLKEFLLCNTFENILNKKLQVIISSIFLSSSLHDFSELQVKFGFSSIFYHLVETSSRNQQQVENHAVDGQTTTATAKRAPFFLCM